MPTVSCAQARVRGRWVWPLGVAEIYIDLLGEYVPLTETLDGVEAILQGMAIDAAHQHSSR
jgi:F0F1-type ATP synthase beta subunit